MATSIITFILQGFEETLVVESCLIDLSKALYVVSHSILCNKLSFYGVHDKGLDLIISYLTDGMV